MKIINRKRFIVFTGFILFVLVVSFGYGIKQFNSLLNEFYNQKELDFINSFKQTKIVIQPGDTSWDIQSKLTPNSNVREILYYVSKINDKKMGEIKPGEILVFLKKEN